MKRSFRIEDELYRLLEQCAHESHNDNVTAALNSILRKYFITDELHYLKKIDREIFRCNAYNRLLHGKKKVEVHGEQMTVQEVIDNIVESEYND